MPEFQSKLNFEYFDVVGGNDAFTTECKMSVAAAQADKVSFMIIVIIMKEVSFLKINVLFPRYSIRSLI